MSVNEARIQDRELKTATVEQLSVTQADYQNLPKPMQTFEFLSSTKDMANQNLGVTPGIPSFNQRLADFLSFLFFFVILMKLQARVRK